MAKRWVAKEHDDASECDPCNAINGTVYRSREAAYRDYPGGVGYKDCVGAKYGNACRGQVVKRRGAERERNSGMTDTRVLQTFRNLMAEHNALMKRHSATPPAPANTKTGEWFKITNVSAEEVAINIFDEIGFWGTTAQGFVDQLTAISAQKITVNVNSPGGEVWDGIAIHTALAQHKAHVTTFNTGLAASAASFIMMAGDTIRQARNAVMMIHDASGLTWGNEADHLAQAALLGKLSDNIADMYAMQAGGTAADWRAKMRAESWYTGQEALAAGLVDEITDADEEPEEPISNRLRIAAFNFAGRAQAPDPEISDPPEDLPQDPPQDPRADLDPADPEDIPDLDPGESLLNEDKAQIMLAVLAGRMKAHR